MRRGRRRGVEHLRERVPAPGGRPVHADDHTGTLKPIAGKNDVFTLTLDQPSPDVTVFTDRPVHRASTESTSGFVRNWDQRGFNQDPPNAALVLDQQPDNADASVFELSHPTYDPQSGAVTYTARDREERSLLAQSLAGLGEQQFVL